jgi:hypothetical protein
MVPSSVFNRRGCELGRHREQHLKIGWNFPHVIIATAHDGNVIETQARAHASLKDTGGRAKVVKGFSAYVEALLQYSCIFFNVERKNVISRFLADRLER